MAPSTIAIAQGQFKFSGLAALIFEGNTDNFEITGFYPFNDKELSFRLSHFEKDDETVIIGRPGASYSLNLHNPFRLLPSTSDYSTDPSHGDAAIGVNAFAETCYGGHIVSFYSEFGPHVFIFELSSLASSVFEGSRHEVLSARYTIVDDLATTPVIYDTEESIATHINWRDRHHNIGEGFDFLMDDIVFEYDRNAYNAATGYCHFKVKDSQKTLEESVCPLFFDKSTLEFGRP